MNYLMICRVVIFPTSGFVSMAVGAIANFFLYIRDRNLLMNRDFGRVMVELIFGYSVIQLGLHHISSLFQNHGFLGAGLGIAVWFVIFRILLVLMTNAGNTWAAFVRGKTLEALMTFVWVMVLLDLAISIPWIIDGMTFIVAFYLAGWKAIGELYRLYTKSEIAELRKYPFRQYRIDHAPVTTEEETE